MLTLQFRPRESAVPSSGLRSRSKLRAILRTIAPLAAMCLLLLAAIAIRFSIAFPVVRDVGHG